MDRNQIVAIIPARGGSKRLSRKNIFPVLGKPMIHYTLDAALKSKYLNKENIYVSSEDMEILELVSGRVKTINRPADLSGDKVWTQDVLNHSSRVLDLRDDAIMVVLQANSPQMEAAVIDKCIDMLLNEKLWQVHTVDKNLINNGAIHVLRNFVKNHMGKVNYNGMVITDWLDIHTIDDIKEVERLLKNE